MTGAGVTSTGAGERLVNLRGAKIEVGGTGGAMEAVEYGLVRMASIAAPAWARPVWSAG
jgi:hypothetical protein